MSRIKGRTNSEPDPSWCHQVWIYRCHQRRFTRDDDHPLQWPDSRSAPPIWSFHQFSAGRWRFRWVHGAVLHHSEKKPYNEITNIWRHTSQTKRFLWFSTFQTFCLQVSITDYFSPENFVNTQKVTLLLKFVRKCSQLVPFHHSKYFLIGWSLFLQGPITFVSVICKINTKGS